MENNKMNNGNQQLTHMSAAGSEFVPVSPSSDKLFDFRVFLYIWMLIVISGSGSSFWALNFSNRPTVSKTKPGTVVPPPETHEAALPQEQVKKPNPAIQQSDDLYKKIHKRHNQPLHQAWTEADDIDLINIERLIFTGNLSQPDKDEIATRLRAANRLKTDTILNTIPSSKNDATAMLERRFSEIQSNKIKNLLDLDVYDDDMTNALVSKIKLNKSDCKMVDVKAGSGLEAVFIKACNRRPKQADLDEVKSKNSIDRMIHPGDKLDVCCNN